MRTSSGGTRMWCPDCKSYEICKAIPGAKVTGRNRDYSQLWYFQEHDDVHWFQRGRMCLTCDYTFLTAEVDNQFLEELVELREALSDLKVNAEQYAIESEKASDSLEKLSESLGVLRALKTYRKA